jgi:hypothetical protein
MSLPPLRRLLSRLLAPNCARRSPGRPRGRHALPLRLEALEDRTAPATFTVRNTNDSGMDSLRQAILDADASADLSNTIAFAIGSGTQTIAVNSALPDLTRAVLLDGTTQPGFAGAPLVVLNGGAFSGGPNGYGLRITASGVTVRGLVLNGFTGADIRLEGAGSDTIAGNYLGTDVTGTRAVPGSASVANEGLFILSPNNTIGGLTAADRNLLSGNSFGVSISGTATSGNLVEGNYIGTDVTGTQPLGNTFAGVALAAPANSVGGTTAGARNLISGNGVGVQITAGQNNVIQGNYVGTDVSGAKALGNGLVGVQVFGGLSHTVGGTAAGAGNLISGNSGAGIDIMAGAVLGNTIGTDVTGSFALGNTTGVAVNGPNVTIGGTAAGAGNLISGNRLQGIFVQSSGVPGGTLIQGNRIGTNRAGTAALPNLTGVALGAFGSNNTVGGTAAGAGNLISGNAAYGIQAANTASVNNLIQGNRIGTDLSGSAAVPNGTGIAIVGSRGNTVGGTAAGAGNLISGNLQAGVSVAGVDGTLIQGNYVGTDASGAKGLANGDGIDLLSGASSVGGTVAGAGNLLSGNTAFGLAVFGSGSLVQGNLIGTDASGATSVGNGGGVTLSGPGNTVGGTTAAARNVISGNGSIFLGFPGGAGVDLFGGGATGNLVEGNYIGTDVTGTKAVLNFYGVVLEDGATGNTVGGTAAGAGNLISGNSIAGMRFLSGGNQAQGNFIGTDASGAKAVANATGVLLQQGAGNTVGGTAAGAGNVISGNSSQGIEVRVSGNLIQGNLIGLTAAGTAALSDAVGVLFSPGSTGAVLGGSAAAAANVISGNNLGVFIRTDGITVQGNRIGTDPSGLKALGNTTGISIDFPMVNEALVGNLLSGNGTGASVGSKSLVEGNLIGTTLTGGAPLPNATGLSVYGSGTTIGGTTAAARNVISGNTKSGVDLSPAGTAAASGNLVEGNYVGTDATGSSALGNATGVSVSGPNNTVGGTAAGAGNLISGNTSFGVSVSAGGTLIAGNTIGTDASGSQPLGNQTGVILMSAGNTVGGTVAAARNLISGNSLFGVQVLGAASGAAKNNLVEGNYLGTDATGSKAVGNGVAGVSIGAINSDSNNNTVGGTVAGAGNLISGNKSDGIDVFNGSGNLLAGNYIGTDAAGATALGNNNLGVLLSGTGSSTVGGVTAAARNVISGNGQFGVYIAGAGRVGNLIEGNYLGTDATGSKAVGNGVAGVAIINSSTLNTIGGLTDGARNVISGNGAGVDLAGSGATGNLVEGNYIGTDATGSKALANGNGVLLGGADTTLNTIGGVTAAARNVISGNVTGVNLSGSGATSNLVEGNYIGTDATGSKALPNNTGISVQGANNTLGGSAAGAGNLISGNTTGVVLSAAGNLVQGNRIGTDASGTQAVANFMGVQINSANNTLGGSAAGAGNLISGNTSNGLVITAGSGNLIQGNRVGTDATGSKAVGNTTGLFLLSANNTVGGAAPGSGNLLSANTTGLSIDASNNLVQGNFVGTDAGGTKALGNQIGVTLIEGSNNSVGGAAPGAGNLISANSLGLLVQGSAQLIQGNLIGTDASGTQALGNGTGVEINTSNNTVGGTTAAARNVISGSVTGIAAGVYLVGNGNAIEGNFLGTDASGSKALGNTKGVWVTSANNTIGGTAPGAGNLISGNSSQGVLDSGKGTLIQGNLIGTDASGSAALGNGTGASLVGSGATVGGTADGARNVLSGNTLAGVSVAGDSGGQRVLGNYVGTDSTGTQALGNGTGVLVTTSGAQVVGNLISANLGDGVSLSSGSNSLVQGNTIGTDVSGTQALGNTRGVFVSSSGNTVGGTAPGAGNLISGNRSNALEVDAGSTLVQGNLIGTDASGSFAVPNNGLGVALAGDANTVGGAAAGAGNVLSANVAGVEVFFGGGNLFQGNRVGTDASGSSALPNVFGLWIAGGSGNTIGGTALGAGNLVSGNSSNGIFLSSGGNLVQGNFIGTDASGSAAVANTRGVQVSSANNTIGGTAPGSGNLISGNGTGVVLSAGTNLLQGNLIGTDAGGAYAVGNGAGVVINSSGNTVGGTAPGPGNLISGNGTGVQVDSSGNLIQGNLIGTDVTGSTAVGNDTGVSITAAFNTVGGTAAGAGNLISANAGDGLTLSGPNATGILVQGNTVGADVSGAQPLGNGGNGVAITGGAHDNTIGGLAPGAANTIAFNANDGVLVDGGAGNSILHDAIFANANLGIELLDGGNDGQPAPALISAASGGGVTTIQGSFTGQPSTLYTLELFANSDPANPQGERFLISLTVLTDADGMATFTASFGFEVPAGQVVTATLTDPLGNTSSFSLGLPVTG